MRLPQLVVDGLIDRTLLAREARKVGFEVTEDEVMERFVNDGVILLTLGVGAPPEVPQGEIPVSFEDKDGTFNAELAKRYPLAFISPPAHHFLNSTFSAQPVFVRREGEASVTLHPDDAAARGIDPGKMVRVFNDRGSFLARAHVSDAARPGLVVGLSIWWSKMCPGGRNANAVTSQNLADMGGGATFHDALVEVASAEEPAAREAPTW